MIYRSTRIRPVMTCRPELYIAASARAYTCCNTEVTTRSNSTGVSRIVMKFDGTSVGSVESVRQGLVLREQDTEHVVQAIRRLFRTQLSPGF
jgi:hypothetical protein